MVDSELDSSAPRRRIRLDLEYDGTDFAGWQAQPGERTVQGAVQEILGRLGQVPIKVTGAGRTDRGCHAAQQVAHCDWPAARASPRELARALAALLPPDIRLRALRPAPPDFHARYSAAERGYCYAIARRCSVFERRRRWELGRRLDLAAMRAASTGLLGEHDFRAYAVDEGEASPAGARPGRCRVTRADWYGSGGDYRFAIAADRFLTRMVRLLVGALVEVGTGERDPATVARALGGPPPSPRPPAAPASGLTLAWVRYAGEPDPWAGRYRVPSRRGLGKGNPSGDAT
jgi:tRNA pseudouridine38-40 synthase